MNGELRIAPEVIDQTLRVAHHESLFTNSLITYHCSVDNGNSEVR